MKNQDEEKRLYLIGVNILKTIQNEKMADVLNILSGVTAEYIAQMNKQKGIEIEDTVGDFLKYLLNYIKFYTKRESQ